MLDSILLQHFQHYKNKTKSNAFSLFLLSFIILSFKCYMLCGTMDEFDMDIMKRHEKEENPYKIWITNIYVLLLAWQGSSDKKNSRKTSSTLL